MYNLLPTFSDRYLLILIRNELFLSISDLSQSINTSLLTSGSETLSYADNCFIFDSVFPIHKKV